SLLPWLQNHRAGITLMLPKKMPSELIKQALGFFRAVALKKDLEGCEAGVILYWSDEKEDYFLHAPEQSASPGHLTYEVGPNPAGSRRFGTIHSHGHGGAFHSATDHHDEENDDGVHITIGNVNTIPSFSCSVVVDGVREQIGLRDVVDNDDEVAFPVEWLKRVRKETMPYYAALPGAPHTWSEEVKSKSVKPKERARIGGVYKL
ncbi:Mov34/MPN/PAD-1 family protein, partial [bacterium]|nr:Mov34/MPN/PAD-1 family protein [bacterium]